MTNEPQLPLKRIPDGYRPRYESREDAPFAVVCTQEVRVGAIAHVLPPAIAAWWASV